MVELIMAQKKAAEQMLMAEMPGVPGMKVNPKYEYDSDEDTEGGTWEHKQRRQEMDATRGENCCHRDILPIFHGPLTLLIFSAHVIAVKSNLLL